jgi:hypothetical protein
MSATTKDVYKGLDMGKIDASELVRQVVTIHYADRVHPALSVIYVSPAGGGSTCWPPQFVLSVAVWATLNAAHLRSEGCPEASTEPVLYS